MPAGIAEPIRVPGPSLKTTVKPTLSQPNPASTVAEASGGNASLDHDVSPLRAPELEWKDGKSNVIARRNALGQLTLIWRDDGGRPHTVAASSFIVSPERPSPAIEADHAWRHSFFYGPDGAVVKEVDCAGQTHDFPSVEARRVDLVRGTALRDHAHVREAGFKGRAPSGGAPIPTE